MYLIWAYLPDEALNSLGITYYPDRYWALAIPAWTFMLALFIYYFYFCYILMCADPLGSKGNFTDNYSIINSTDPLSNFYTRELGGIPEISDLPIEVVNYCLYS
ncbi:Phosphatidylinositol N-acetylglucosaminyltransferase subunit P [Smittium culicis]|uniref:Phosphatidylinositol N-acetylglucosaminyltransferase subunit P n=1 Tax=Smittium culicis TaxID=133412 RepID=A0A1R1Y578_9FUNG|nr:Phosphatidylinositol N-acetylglucosaminyltransferase subunit P [Smittium culicis]